MRWSERSLSDKRRRSASGDGSGEPGLPSSESLERARRARAVRFAGRQLWRAAQLQISAGETVDAFETVVAAILQRQGYWTLTSAKVELTKQEKRKIGRPSTPRWELDVVAYRGSENELLAVECKSFLDSPGVERAAFDGSSKEAEKRYKLFAEPTLRKVVFGRLKQQLVSAGFCAPKPSVRLCLAAGKVRGEEQWLEAHFKKQGWLFFGPKYIRSELCKLRDAGYENNVAAVVAKILLREGGVSKPVRGVDADV